MTHKGNFPVFVLKFSNFQAESLEGPSTKDGFSYMNDKEYQSVSVKNSIFPFVGLLMLLGLAVLPLNHNSQEEKMIKARTKAEVLAYQVAQLYRESLPAQQGLGRGPASVDSSLNGEVAAEGLMGQDPWGHAYTYKISPMSDGKLRVEMRSAGPGKTEGHEPSTDVVLVVSL